MLLHRRSLLLPLLLRVTMPRVITSSTRTISSTESVRHTLSPFLLLGHIFFADSGSPFSLIADRVVKKLGEGTFGKVVEAVDRNTKKSYAVKIIRAVQKYRDASKIEIRVLNELKRGDPNNEKSVQPLPPRSRCRTSYVADLDPRR